MFRSSRVQVRVIPSEGGLSSPRHVIERLDAYRDEFQIGGDDQLWLMIDVDRWGSRNLSQVCRAARQKGYRLAVSNPCFELWIYLHLLDLTGAEMECSWYEQQIRAHHGSYNKSNLAVGALKPLVNDAIRRARHATNDSHLWPVSTGTDVFRVVEQVHNLESAQIYSSQSTETRAPYTFKLQIARCSRARATQVRKTQVRKLVAPKRD